MKRKIILVALMATIASTVIIGQKISSEKIPLEVKQSFEKSYPNAKNTKWDEEGDNAYEASFKLNADELSVVIDKKGQISEIEKEIPFSMLPLAVQTALKGKKVKEAAIITKGNKTMYEAEVNGKDLIFDGNGKKMHN